MKIPVGLATPWTKLYKVTMTSALSQSLTFLGHLPIIPKHVCCIRTPIKLHNIEFSNAL